VFFLYINTVLIKKYCKCVFRSKKTAKSDKRNFLSFREGRKKEKEMTSTKGSLLVLF
jgi:hypothetical protein